MLKPQYLINRLKSRRIFIYALVIALISIFCLSISASLIGKISTKNKVLSRAHITFKPSGSYVAGELIVRFREGFIPEELASLEKENLKNETNIFGKIINTYNNTERNILGYLRPKEQLDQINNVLKKLGVISYEKLYNSKEKSLKGFYVLHLQEGSSLPDIQLKLSSAPFLYSSEANDIATIEATPNDPNFSQLWGMQKVQAPLAWDITIGSSQILVAVVDTGADFNHPDLSANLVPGYNFISNTSLAQDDLGHGTHVSGTVGAVGNNNIGVVGINWNVRIMPIKVCAPISIPPYNSCPTGATTQGVVYAADNGAKVINMSLGGRASCQAGSAYGSAISYAISKGAIVVVAAGNDGADAQGYSPAGCPGTLTVGASTQNDARAGFSNYGSVVGIASPGTAITSTYPTGNVSMSCKNPPGSLSYCTLQGTSMASPLVAGAAALLLSVNPNLTPDQVENCLVQNGDPITTDRPIGGVRLNIFKALQACSSGNPPPSPSLSPTTRPSITVSPTPTLRPGEPTNTPTLTPTPSPTSAPLPTRGFESKGTPVPTPDQYFSCKPDPNCVKSGKTIQLCPLVCTPQP